MKDKLTKTELASHKALLEASGPLVLLLFVFLIGYFVFYSYHVSLALAWVINSAVGTSITWFDAGALFYITVFSLTVFRLMPWEYNRDNMMLDFCIDTLSAALLVAGNVVLFAWCIDSFQNASYSVYWLIVLTIAVVVSSVDVVNSYQRNTTEF